MKRYLYIVFLVFLALTACEREIPYDGEYQDPKLVVQALLYSGSDTISCFVSRSYFFLEDKPAVQQPLAGVSFDISSSMTDLRILSDRVEGNKHLLKLSSPLQAGDTVGLSVSHPQFGTAEATEIIMPVFVPEELSAVLDTAESNRWWWRFSLRLPDYPFPESVIGMYGVAYYTDSLVIARYNMEDKSIIQWDTIVRHYTIEELSSQDNIFALFNNTNVDGVYYGHSRRPLTFSAGYPSDKQLALYMRAQPSIGTRTSSSYPEYSLTRRLDSLHLCFQVMGETYNQYIASMQAYFDNSGDDVDRTDIGSYAFDMIGMEEEPVPLYSNVTNGYGILISKTTNSIPITSWTVK